MKNLSKKNIARAIAIPGFMVLAGLLNQASAQDNRELTQTGEPARWFQEEMTPVGYFKTLKKEAEAVYQLSIIECKRTESARRNQCVREAKDNLQQDLQAARQKSGYQGR